MKKALNSLLAIVLMLGLSSCGSMGQKLKAFLGGKAAPSQQATAVRKPSRTFKNQSSYMPVPHRNYKRMTQEKLEDQSRVDEKAGSLWVMEGQSSYLFSQNIMRMIGDPIPIRLDGEPKEQLGSKVGVIKKLLNKLEMRRRRLQRLPAEAQKAVAKATKPGANKKAPAQNLTKKQPLEADQTEFAVRTVPTRIVERLVDGNYRVKGGQPFMIGSREYKVIVTGIVRAADFSDEGISATKLLDPKFDIVSTRTREASL